MDRGSKQQIQMARRAAAVFNCVFDWSPDHTHWALSHRSGYLPAISYVPWRWDPEQVRDDATVLARRYAEEFPDDPMADSLRLEPTGEWQSKWFPHVVAFDPPLTFLQENGLAEWCRETIGPHGYRFICTKLRFSFRTSEEAERFRFPYVVDLDHKASAETFVDMVNWCHEFIGPEGALTYIASQQRFYFRSLAASVMFRLMLSEWGVA